MCFTLKTGCEHTLRGLPCRLRSGDLNSAPVTAQQVLHELSSLRCPLPPLLSTETWHPYSLNLIWGTKICHIHVLATASISFLSAQTLHPAGPPHHRFCTLRSRWTSTSSIRKALYPYWACFRPFTFSSSWQDSIPTISTACTLNQV